MNKEEFQEEARKILHRQSPEQVEKFLTNFPYNPALYGYEVFDGVQNKITDKFYFEHAKEALAHLKLINHDRYLPSGWKQDFNNVIKDLEKVVAFNNKWESRHGNSKLSETDEVRLTIMQEVFEDCFPHLETNLKNSNFRDLCVLLLEKTVPQRKSNKKIDKVK